MKLRQILVPFFVPVIVLALLTSCSDDENYDFPGISYARVYFDKPGTINSGSIVKTPLGYAYSIDAQYCVKTTSASKEDAHIFLEMDNSYVEKYNLQNGTSYVPAPQGSISFDKTSLTIPAGNTASADTLTVTIVESYYSQFTGDNDYLVPIVIARSDNPEFGPSRDYSVRYLKLSYKETIINTDAKAPDITGTLVTDYSTWTCLDAVGINADDFQMVFSDSWSDAWNFDEGQSECTFTIDMQQERNVTAFYCTSYFLNDLDVKLSSDNATWTNCGNVKVTDLCTDDHGNNCVVFYGAMPCRYLRITMRLNTTSTWWRYYAYVSSFGVYEKNN